ncbi:protein kinase [Nonomuraea sp. NPDC005983]|uniref:protein kinase domain-containing protein n=1 Tax=Nonomuraea sp. NPDC005983 TaxID=3155595 RepID=UPI0033A1B0E7
MVPGYREVRQLGAGHTGRVFLATYETTGAYVAIKYLNATLRRDAEFMDRFRADTHALVELDDPHVVKLYEYVETPTRAAVVAELVDGVSLRTLLAEHGRISPEAALTVLKATLLALAAAHDKGVPHRDVKPENVLVQADGASKLADFGVVVHAEAPGVPAGSPAYMSPELWTHRASGPPADLYAAACVLFEAVKGRPPYRADGALALRDQHLMEPVPLEVVPDPLRDLLKRGLAKDPAARYASARQFAAELEEDAVAGYGPDWEQRGRRHLGELATLLALRFPLAKPDATADAPARTRDRVRVPRLPPHLWIAGATVATVMIALLASGGRLPPGPGTVLMPPPETAEPAPTSADTTTRTPTSPRTSARPTGPTRADPTTPPVPRTSAPLPTGPLSARAPSSPAVSSPAVSSPAASSPAVQSASIVQWSGSAGAVRVAADGPGPVRLQVSFTRRDDDGPARTLARETRTLAGNTAYTDTVLRDLGAVPCGRRAHFGIVVLTEPAAANGPQVSEVEVAGPACPTPPPSPSPTDLPTASTSAPTPAKHPSTTLSETHAAAPTYEEPEEAGTPAMVGSPTAATAVE